MRGRQWQSQYGNVIKGTEMYMVVKKTGARRQNKIKAPKKRRGNVANETRVIRKEGCEKGRWDAGKARE